MKYNVFKERNNTVYYFGHPIGLELLKMLSPTGKANIDPKVRPVRIMGTFISVKRRNV
jgi:hypothetical protein